MGRHDELRDVRIYTATALAEQAKRKPGCMVHGLSREPLLGRRRRPHRRASVQRESCTGISDARVAIGMCGIGLFYGLLWKMAGANPQEPLRMLLDDLSISGCLICPKR